MERLERAWINQPSTLQPLHNWNGKNVLRGKAFGGLVTVYFTDGDIISAMVPSNVLSKGWINV